MFNNQILLVFGFAIAIFVIVITIYLIRNRENSIRNTANLIPDPTGPFVSYGNIKDMYISYNSDNGDLSSNSIEELLSKPINDGIIKAYKDLRDKLVGGLETNYVSTDKLYATSFNMLPRGVIVAFYGTDKELPIGWAICDGSPGTPDLRGRFILGSGDAGSGSGRTNRNPDESGGMESVTLTAAQMPTHTHAFSDNAPSGYTYKFGENTFAKQTAIKTYQILNSTTGAAGGNESHTNMPPFYVLRYIMKL